MQAEQQPRHTNETDDEFNERNQAHNQSENKKTEEESLERQYDDLQSLGKTALESSEADSKRAQEDILSEHTTMNNGREDEEQYRNFIACILEEQILPVGDRIEEIEDPDDKDLVLSIVPECYDKNGWGKYGWSATKQRKHDLALRLAIRYANRDNKSIGVEDFIEHEISEKKRDLKASRPLGYRQDEDGIIDDLQDALDVVRQAYLCRETQESKYSKSVEDGKKILAKWVLLAEEYGSDSHSYSHLKESKDVKKFLAES